MLSLASEYYQVLLAQGVCVGIGSAILYVPSISLVASRFERRRPLAVFVATSGTSVGPPPHQRAPSRCLSTLKLYLLLTQNRRHNLPYHLLPAPTQDRLLLGNPRSRLRHALRTARGYGHYLASGETQHCAQNPFVTGSHRFSRPRFHGFLPRTFLDVDRILGPFFSPSDLCPVQSRRQLGSCVLCSSYL